jgi:NAD(P)-dependent dehydrogenase (short-subunit alcohol dehydrogenase family)
MPHRAAIVTGGSSGIGLEIARMLGREGFGITLAARRPDKLEAAAKELAGLGVEVQHVAGIIGEEEVVARIVAAHRERFGRLDVLINNAGVGAGDNVTDMTAKKIDLQLATNLRSVLLMYRDCTELLRAAVARSANRGCRSTRRRRPGSSPSPRRCTASWAPTGSRTPRCAPHSSTRR